MAAPIPTADHVGARRQSPVRIDPDRVTPEPHTAAQVDGTVLRAQLPPASWSMSVPQLS